MKVGDKLNLNFKLNTFHELMAKQDDGKICFLDRSYFFNKGLEPGTYLCTIQCVFKKYNLVRVVSKVGSIEAFIKTPKKEKKLKIKKSYQYERK